MTVDVVATFDIVLRRDIDANFSANSEKSSKIVKIDVSFDLPDDFVVSLQDTVLVH